MRWNEIQAFMADRRIDGWLVFDFRCNNPILARLLTELAQPDGDRLVVAHKLTQQDIAERIGSSREMVNRVLKELFAGGYVSLHDGRYTLHRKLPARW